MVEILSETNMGTNKGVWANLDARHDTGVNASSGVAADYGTEFILSSIYKLTLNHHLDVSFVEAEISQDRTGTEGTAIADYGVADIIGVKPSVIANIGGLHLSGIAHNAVSADMAVISN